MFEGSLVESTSLIAQRNRWPAVASVALQAMFAVAVLSIPLIHPESLALHAPQLALIAPAIKPPQPPTPPPQRVRVTESSTPSMPTPTAPVTLGPRIHDFLHPSANADTAPPVGTLVSMGPSNGNGLPFTMSPGNNGPAIAVARPKSTVPTRISQGISAGLLLAPIQPAYPPIARVTHTEGTVVVHAIISKEGKIISAQVTSGPAMLQGAALDAVRTARYRPYLLNGDPTEVETTFTVNFRMNS